MVKKKEFFRKEHIPELIMALKGRKEIPMKFEYIGKSGAENWDKLVQSKHYGVGLKELNLIKNNMNTITNSFENKKFNLIDLGPGNGIKTIPFIEEFGKTHNLVNLAILDISEEMANLAVKNIKKKIKKNLKIKRYTIDFEEGNFAKITKELKKEDYPNNFLVLLGNTVGNQFDRYRVLLNIRGSMGLSDYLLIGLEMRREKDYEKIVKHYHVKEVYDTITTNLGKLGIDKNKGKIEIIYNKKKNQVEGKFVLAEDIIIKIEKEKFKFKRGDKILLMISYKATISDLRNLLAETGYKMIKYFVDKEKSYALVLCQPIPL
ncbi:MAG: L-histidine N(alpha)-methyltransferase [Nanoarchaeota archaeon]|nr:L-histidine N(alpha)-methyltransferase [Nanoarchaeota archaeon]